MFYFSRRSFCALFSKRANDVHHRTLSEKDEPDEWGQSRLFPIFCVLVLIFLWAPGPTQCSFEVEFGHHYINPLLFSIRHTLVH